VTDTFTTRQITELAGLDAGHSADVRVWRFADRLPDGLVHKDEHSGKYAWSRDGAGLARLHFALEAAGIDPKSRVAHDLVARAAEFRGEQWKDRVLIASAGGVEVVEPRMVEQRAMDLIIGKGGTALIVPLEQYMVQDEPDAEVEDG
jgi:hypothetical protein